MRYNNNDNHLDDDYGVIADEDESCCGGDDLDLNTEGQNHSTKQLEQQFEEFADGNDDCMSSM